MDVSNIVTFCILQVLKIDVGLWEFDGGRTSQDADPSGRDENEEGSLVCVTCSDMPMRAWNLAACAFASWGCSDKAPSMGWFKKQEFISHTSGNWAVQGQGASRFCCRRGPSSWLADAAILLCPHTASPQGGLRGRESVPFF